MKKIIIASIIAVTSLGAYASCRYFTINDGGRIKMCTECCYGNQCTITCN